MTTKINIFTEDWCNLVFEGKNKAYGAYELRQDSSKRHALAILLSISLFAFAVSAPSLLKTIVPEKRWRVTDVNTMADLNNAKPEEIRPPIELPQTPLRRTIAFTPPVITNDDIAEAPPVIESMLHTNALIGTTPQEGTDDPAATESLNRVLTEETAEPVRFVPQMPEYIGGEEARIRFLKDNLRYPSIASELGITGKVILQFVVNTDGNISKITVLRGIGGGCDEEAVRVAKLMPPWRPGRQNGKAVPVYFVMPINFTLQN